MTIQYDFYVRNEVAKSLKSDAIIPYIQKGHSLEIGLSVPPGSMMMIDHVEVYVYAVDDRPKTTRVRVFLQQMDRPAPWTP
jgi:hypothetical protein